MWASPPCVDTVGKSFLPGTVTGRSSVIVENVAPLVVGIPLRKYGRRWRMALADVGERWPGADQTPFGSREAALKWARRSWPRARVSLTTYGLRVFVHVPDWHTATAIRSRTTRHAAKRMNFHSLYSRQPAALIEVDFAEIEKQVAASLSLLKDSGLEIGP